MTQDEIIELARQASFTENSGFKGCLVCNTLSLEYFAKLVADKSFKDGYAIGEATGFKQAIKLERARGKA